MLSRVLILLLMVSGLARAQERNVFGEKNVSEAALMGIFYDLKQTQDGKPTNLDVNQYWAVLDEFWSKGWDETVLNRYYRITQPLYTTQIYIPNISAASAPSAFGAPPSVKASRWVIHYKGQVSPPERGTYRFWASCDDVIGIAVDGKTVLAKPWSSTATQVFPKTNWVRDRNKTNPLGLKTQNNRLQAGDWVELKSDEIYDLDILIGERPGGLFDAFVMIEKQGGQYEQTPEGPVLPVFQVAPYDTPPPVDKRGPRFAKGGLIWKSYQ
ncbi:MAG: hypothetical protein LBK60_05565 [Verrucomicrobiales bacterium]|jgi:hypothetical protein|nr:hypothetical protein [Verrucomicrobiales bacterium]